MAYSVPYAFGQFFEAINLPGDHRETANKRRDRIVSLLENDFTIVDAFPTGSIPKFTAVKGYADLDVMVVLHYGKHMEGKLPSQVLKAVRDALGEYETGVRRNGQAVTLSYKSWPNVDIVPVFYTQNDSGGIAHYNVPNMNTEEWLVSKPKTHARNVADRTSSYGREFRRIIKMIKWWNHQHSGYLQSYHIEALALKILNGKFSNYPWEVYYFFDEAYKLVESPLWYAGAYVDEYLDYSDRQEALKRLKTARDKASDAWFATYGTNSDDKKAIELWGQVFGSKFPAYG